jgi:hypothetical protein
VIRTPALRRWWPTTQALDLVEGDVATVAAALHAETTRVLKGERLAAAWTRCATLDDAFDTAGEFTNVPTHWLVLPTRSRWSVLWNNSFLCDGYDSLCHCLTAFHGLTTLHWSAHDATTTFQPGAAFTHRRVVAGAIAKRTVCVACTDGRWSFDAIGERLPEEDLATYGARRVRDRLNEAAIASLLARLGAAPWDEAFYALGRHDVFVLRRPAAPATVLRRARHDVVRGE